MSKPKLLDTNSTKNTVKKNLFQESGPAFLCTICWQYQPFGFKPKILGQSARIVCERCWRAVLDLSICWVCGECIFRGDEVVSLGWCFWHLSCFGCLICGMRLSLPKYMNMSDKFSEGSDQKLYSTSKNGIELETVPLCEFCEIEMEGEEKEEVLERGLMTVSIFDGGLSRQRIEYLGVSENRSFPIRKSELDKSESRFTSSSSSDDSNNRFYNGSADELSSLLDNAAKMSFSRIGDEEYVDENDYQEEHNLSTSESDNELMSSPIYLSIFDPLGESAFTPSTTKPLPKWMNLLPKDIHLIREKRTHLVPAADSLHSEEAEILCSSKKNCPNEVLDDLETNASSPLSDKTVKGEDRKKIYSENFTNISGKHSQTRQLNTSSPRERPILVLPKVNRQSWSHDTAYLTPPEYPSSDILDTEYQI